LSASWRVHSEGKKRGTRERAGTIIIRRVKKKKAQEKGVKVIEVQRPESMPGEERKEESLSYLIENSGKETANSANVVRDGSRA